MRGGSRGASEPVLPSSVAAASGIAAPSPKQLWRARLPELYGGQVGDFGEAGLRRVEAGIVQVFDPAAEPVLGPSVSGLVGQSRTNRRRKTDDAVVLRGRNKAA